MAMQRLGDRQRVQFFLPKDLYEALRFAAFERRTSQQKLVVQWLRDCLDAQKYAMTMPHEESENAGRGQE